MFANSLCDYLSRDKSVQSCPLSCQTLWAVATVAYDGLCSFSAEEQWKVLGKLDVSSHSVRTASQVMPIRLKSTWGDWSTERECSLPPTPREMDSDMSCLNKKLKFLGCTIDSVAKYSKSNRELCHIWPTLEFVGVTWEGGSEDAEMCLSATCLMPSILLMNFSGHPLPTPTSAVWAEHHVSYLAHFLLHPQLQVTNVNIPSVYSMMEFVYLFDCSLFWTKIFVSFYWNVHTVNVC